MSTSKKTTTGLYDPVVQQTTPVLSSTTVVSVSDQAIGSSIVRSKRCEIEHQLKDQNISNILSDLNSRQIDLALNGLGNKLNDALDLKDTHDGNVQEIKTVGTLPQSERCLGTPKESWKSVEGYVENLTIDDVIKHLIKFDGSSHFHIFRRTFQTFVINNPNFTDDTKFILLEQHLEGRAASCLQYLKNTAEALKETFIGLEFIYGREADVTELHDKFIALPFSHDDCNQMLWDLQAHRAVINLLKEQGLNVDDERTLVPFCKKLPERIISDILPILSEDYREWKFVQIHEAVVNSIETLLTMKKYLGQSNNNQRSYGAYVSNVAQVQEISSYPYPYIEGSQQNASEHRYKVNKGQRSLKFNRMENNYDDGPMINVMPYSFPFNQPETKHLCNVCGGPHHPIRCPLKSWDFRRIATEKMLCELCLSPKHRIEQCKSTFCCGYCKGRHHMGGCYRKEFYRDIRNYPQSAGSIVYEELPKTFFRGLKYHQ